MVRHALPLRLPQGGRVRAAIVAALLADGPTVALVGDRVRPRLGLFGGLDATRDFTAEGELEGPAIVVVSEARVRHEDDRGSGSDRLIRAVQTIALFAYAPAGLGGDAYAAIRAVHLAARRRLHRAGLAGSPGTPAAIVPLEEPVRLLDIRWASFGPEQVEGDRAIPVVAARYDLTITDPL